MEAILNNISAEIDGLRREMKKSQKDITEAILLVLDSNLSRERTQSERLEYQKSEMKNRMINKIGNAKTDITLESIAKRGADNMNRIVKENQVSKEVNHVPFIKLK